MHKKTTEECNGPPAVGNRTGTDSLKPFRPNDTEIIFGFEGLSGTPTGRPPRKLSSYLLSKKKKRVRPPSSVPSDTCFPVGSTWNRGTWNLGSRRSERSVRVSPSLGDWAAQVKSKEVRHQQVCHLSFWSLTTVVLQGLQKCDTFWGCRTRVRTTHP